MELKTSQTTDRMRDAAKQAGGAFARGWKPAEIAHKEGPRLE